MKKMILPLIMLMAVNCFAAGSHRRADVLPHADGTYDLGSSSLEWEDLYIDGTAYIDAIGESVSLTGNMTLDGLLIEASGTQVISATGTAIVPTDRVMLLTMTSDIESEAEPLISTTSFTSGTKITLVNFSTHSLTIQGTDDLAGTLVNLSADEVILDQYDYLELQLLYGFWFERGYGNLDGGLCIPEGTEDELKAVTPSRAGEIYFDSTNNAIVVSSGTGAGEFVQAVDGSSTPTGW